MRRYIGILLFAVAACGQSSSSGTNNNNNNNNGNNSSSLSRQEAVKLISEISAAVISTSSKPAARDSTHTYNLNCSGGGTVTLVLTLSTPTSSGVMINYNSTFAQCNDGKNTFDGSTTVDVTTQTAAGTGSISSAYNGTLTVKGDLTGSLTFKNLTIDVVTSGSSGSFSGSETFNGEVDAVVNGVTQTITFNNEKWSWDGTTATQG